nr:ninja-family protein AFP3-like [Ipomoea batatas]
MAEAEELRGMGCFSLARDPLNLCVNGSSFPANFDRRIQTKERNGGGAVAGGEEGEIELSLGLSLNGKFGVDPNRAQKLKRCSSISSFALNGEGTGARAFSPYAPPLILSNGNALPSSQGSSVSQGSGSSGVSDFDSQPLQVCGKNVEARSPSSLHSRELEPRPPAIPSSLHSRELEHRPATVLEPAVNNSGNSGKNCKEVVRNAMFNMPCVTTRGDGPNGKKIEGFLYRYRKGEEVRIVCVCHGSFLSPAEFVKHAGGGDVAHPLKHIIVSPSCLF